MNPPQNGQHNLPANSYHQGYQNGYHGQQAGYQGNPQFPTQLNGYQAVDYYGNQQLVENYPNQMPYYGNQVVQEQYHHGSQPIGYDNSYQTQPHRGRGRGQGQRSRGRGQSGTYYSRNDSVVGGESRQTERDVTPENESHRAQPARNATHRGRSNPPRSKSGYESRHETHHDHNKRPSGPTHDPTVTDQDHESFQPHWRQQDAPRAYGRQQEAQQDTPRAYGRQQEASRAYGRQQEAQQDTPRAYGRQQEASRAYGRQQEAQQDTPQAYGRQQEAPRANGRQQHYSTVRGSANRGSGTMGGYNNRKSRNAPHRGQGQGRSYHNFKQGSQEDIETQRGLLIEQLTNNSYECMVCCDVVKRDASVWGCGNCYHVYHLYCIKRWAQSSTASEDGSSGWRCPACQNVNQQYPSQYRCFCGKLRNPDLNRHEIPHSCGEVCKKKRTNNCTHPCNILCHPGPCPPCLASITKHCDCGKTKQTVKCVQASTLKCAEKCEKTLNCGRHECQQVCHAGSCDPCSDEVKQVCYCSKDDKTILCGSSDSFSNSYSCKLVCDRTLLCGKHSCDRSCHPGTCMDCSLLPSVITHCPCGQSRLSELGGASSTRASCTDPVPTCGAVCGKSLPCGPKGRTGHVCETDCHPGPCGQCQGMSETMCRCGCFTKEMTCQDAAQYTEETPFLCEKRCNKRRQCGKHKCGQLCCVDTEHTCDQVCGHKLTCGKHRCEEQCHRTKCPTCWQVSFDELRCYCGQEVLYPPIPCGTSPPECKRLCTRQHVCNHTVRHNCHSDQSCPQCAELTEKWCHGKHEMRRNIPCHQQDVSCGLPCNTQLSCQVHKCQTTCHKGECLADSETCTQPCPKPRTDCSHPCAAPCHGTGPCPQMSCRSEVTLRCDCGNRAEKALCMQGGDRNSDFLKMETSMLAFTMSNAQDGQSVDISSMMKDANKKKQRKLECNSECSLRERNKRLALALEISNPDLSSKLGNPTYTPFLKDYAKQYTTFTAGVEQEMSKLVTSAQQSKKPKRSYAFKPMNSNQRRLVHELADLYGCETQSYDDEPNKNVVATAHKGKCWLPGVTLTQSTLREINPKAPTPIPHHSKESDIRSAVEGSKKSTSVLGAWSKLRPTVPTATPTKLAPWATTVTATVPKVTDTNQGNGKLKSFSVLRKEKSVDGKCSPVIDYFDMSG